LAVRVEHEEAQGGRNSGGTGEKEKKGRGGEERGQNRHFTVVLSLSKPEMDILLATGVNLTTTKVSISKLLHFQCPPAKGGHLQCPRANFALGILGKSAMRAFIISILAFLTMLQL
jgi:hypothetical protein